MTPELLTELFQTIAAQVPDLLWLDLWKEQLLKPEEHDLNLPCLLLSYNAQRQTCGGTAQITAYLAFRNEEYPPTYLNVQGTQNTNYTNAGAIQILTIKENIIHAINQHSGEAVFFVTQEQLINDFDKLTTFILNIDARFCC